MSHIFDLNKMIYDNSLWLAVIAINMTIIGFTSLAETKKIIGVDYGKFLIKNYKVMGMIRIYYLLILFAFVNIISLITMFTIIDEVRTANLIILLFNLIFAIYYFFAFILIENSSVKRQILKEEILGMYYNSEQVTTFYPDIIVEMNNGSRTEKRLSTNVITYFNVFNNETQKSFEEVFGSKSLLYSDRKSLKKYWKTQWNQSAYDYKSTYGNQLVHISHEFFQLFRYSDLQEKWVLEILRLFNNEKICRHTEYKMDNLIRITGHIINFGICERLYKYKFIEYFERYFFDAIEKKEVITEKIIKKEKYLISEFSRFLFIAFTKNEELVFGKMMLNIFKRLTFTETYKGYLDVDTNLKLIFTVSKNFDNVKIKTLMTELYNDYLKQLTPGSVGVEDLKRIVEKENEVYEYFTVEAIYG